MSRGYELGESLWWMFPDHTTIYPQKTTDQQRMSVIVQADIDRFVSTNSHNKNIGRQIFPVNCCECPYDDYS